MEMEKGSSQASSYTFFLIYIQYTVEEVCSCTFVNFKRKKYAYSNLAVGQIFFVLRGGFRGNDRHGVSEGIVLFRASRRGREILFLH